MTEHTINASDRAQLDVVKQKEADEAVEDALVAQAAAAEISFSRQDAKSRIGNFLTKAELSPDRNDFYGKVSGEIDKQTQDNLERKSDAFEEAHVAAETVKNDAREHYESDREGYHEAAIQDANEAGVDITFKGQEFPAGQPKQPQDQ